MKRMIFVSNRLPVDVQKKSGKLVYQDSIGGLATALDSIYKQYDCTWVGWPGITSNKLSPADIRNLRSALKKRHCHPVILTKDESDNYYQGFSNRTIWPLFHYFVQYTETSEKTWNSYVNVNKVFADEIVKIAKPEDVIWIHDYHFLLLPQMVRERIPEASIGFFLHIPFPSYEIFRLLPWREELLKGLLGSDLVGFHTYDYVHHFLQSVRRLIGYDDKPGLITIGDRIVKVNAFPLGIDYEHYSGACDTPKVKKEIKKIHKHLGDRKVILSMDRLDYTKGISNRLVAFDRFLQKYPQFKEKVTLIMVTSPSRTNVETYKALKRDVEIKVGEVNGKHTRLGWVPVWFIYRKIPFHQLIGLYSSADVALITPVRDGMNLMAKEFLATKRDQSGVLILSELAGASKELGEALIVNPNNIEGIADAIYNALMMPPQEQKKRNLTMQKRLQRYTSKQWTEDFLAELDKVKSVQNKHMSKRLLSETQKLITNAYKISGNRLIILDYDGTLTPFKKRPEDAIPDSDLLQLLKNICNDDENEVLLISGRDKDTLEKWFGHLDMNLVAEHGAWFKERGKEWKMIQALANKWKHQIHTLLESYVMKTPGAFVEEKDYSLAWHYRKADQEQAKAQISELMPTLVDMTTGMDVDILEGNKVIEIKNRGVNKGRAARKWLKKKKWNFILAIGDDWTDEDMFEVIPSRGHTIRVGFTHSKAKYHITNYEAVRKLLRSLR